MRDNKSSVQKFINSIKNLQQARCNILLIGMLHEHAHGSMPAIKEPGMMAANVLHSDIRKDDASHYPKFMPGHNGQVTKVTTEHLHTKPSHNSFSSYRYSTKLTTKTFQYQVLISQQLSWSQGWLPLTAEIWSWVLLWLAGHFI